MVQVLEFALLVIGISASGVMSPGPLFAANVSWGLREGARSGLKMALGHTIVELPLIILLGIGVFSLEAFPEFRDVISIFGAFVLFIFAALQIRTTFIKKESSIITPKQGPLVTGVLFTGLNPFFIIWWFTVGFKLLSDAMMIWAFMGILILFMFHIWMDFVWMGAISYLASKSKKIISNRNYKIVMTGLSLVLIYFGITFLGEALL